MTSQTSFDPETLCLVNDTNNSTCHPITFGVVYHLNSSTPNNQSLEALEVAFSFPVHMKYSPGTYEGGVVYNTVSLTPWVYLISENDIVSDNVSENTDDADTDIFPDCWTLQTNNYKLQDNDLCSNCDDNSYNGAFDNVSPCCCDRFDGFESVGGVGDVGGVRSVDKGENVWSTLKHYHRNPFTTNIHPLNTSNWTVIKLYNAMSSSLTWVDIDIGSSLISVSAMPIGNLHHLPLVDTMGQWLSLLGCCSILICLLLKWV